MPGPGTPAEGLAVAEPIAAALLPMDRSHAAPAREGLAPEILATEAVPALARLDAGERERLRETLLDDLVTEYDARHLDVRLRAGAVPWSRRFQAVEEAWLRDEEDHYRGFLLLQQELFGFDASCLEDRRGDFRHLEEFLDDEFATCILGAFDELVTIRGYKGNLHRYDLLGPAVRRFLRAVIADEGRHYHHFFQVAVEEHPQRLAEGPEILARARALAGRPYRQTFLLDHDDPVYGAPIFDEAAGILEARLRRALGERGGTAG